MLDEVFGVTEPEHQGLREMRHGIGTAAERLIGDGNIVVRGGMARIQRERLRQ